MASPKLAAWPEAASDTVEKIVKDRGGIVAVSKRMVEHGESFGLTEHQFTEQVMQAAKRDGVSFERLFSTPEIWQACDICKSFNKAAPDYMNITPVQVDGRDFSDINITTSPRQSSNCRRWPRSNGNCRQR